MDTEREDSQEDWRTRRDRTEMRNIAFESQMPSIVRAYMHFCAQEELPAREGPACEETYTLSVADLFGTSAWTC